ncbi:MAG: antibiotic biosynthesis monooxygenase family protein [Thermomicrobiales bacterium]
MRDSQTPNSDQLIFINVFTVLPENQVRLLEILTHVTDTFVRHAPGFISSTLYRGLDGDKVTMYAIWQSEEAYMAMRGDPGPSAYLQEAMTIAKFEPSRYQVAHTFIGDT